MLLLSNFSYILLHNMRLLAERFGRPGPRGAAGHRLHGNRVGRLFLRRVCGARMGRRRKSTV